PVDEMRRECGEQRALTINATNGLFAAIGAVFNAFNWDRGMSKSWSSGGRHSPPNTVKLERENEIISTKIVGNYGCCVELSASGLCD
ncbi:MAG: hypothetical protein AAFY83_13275, partial [Pseudomonadota bacterium]